MISESLVVIDDVEEEAESTADHIRSRHNRAREVAFRGNRSASENLTLAIRSPYGIPCPHGNPTCIRSRGLGTDSL